MSKFKNMRSDSGNLLSGLLDMQFTSVVTTQMVPTIYTLGLVISALASIYCVGWAFGESLVMGVAWLVVVGPAMFIALTVTIRVLLEFVLTVFRIAFFLEALGGQIDTIANQTEDLSEGLPRIRFWKPRRKQSGDK